MHSKSDRRFFPPTRTPTDPNAQEAYEEAEADLFTVHKKAGKRSRTTGGEDEDEEDAFFASLSNQDRVPKFAELLKFRSLSVGMKMWAAVADARPRELVLSLPHGLKGHVAYAQSSDTLAELSKKAAATESVAEADSVGRLKKGKRTPQDELPPLSDLFKVGQLVRCVVVGLRGAVGVSGGAGGADATPSAHSDVGDHEKSRKRVEVSLLPSLVNAGVGVDALREGFALPASVHSVEDHGFTLSFGIKGVSGFLLKADAPEGVAPVQAGSLVEAVIEKPAEGRLPARVTCRRPAVVAAASKEWDGLTVESLLPGSLVTARVRSVLSDGLLVSFLTFFTGTIDPFHLGTPPSSALSAKKKKKGRKGDDKVDKKGKDDGEKSSSGWASGFEPDQKIKARVLYVDPGTKKVGLTALPALLAMESGESAFPATGAVFDSARVLRVDPGLGVLCALGSKEDSDDGSSLVSGYVHISNVADVKVDEIEAVRRRRGCLLCLLVFCICCSTTVLPGSHSLPP
jgi:rRNA biogenesis protein RRP5